MHFVCLATRLLKTKKSARHNPLFANNYATHPPILIFFTDRLSSKLFLIWLLKIQPRLKYVTTVPCNLSLITALVCDSRSFSDIIVSLGSVAMHKRFGGGSLIHTLLQWRSQDLEVGTQWVWGTEVPQRSPGAEPLVGVSGGEAPPPESLQHITDIWLPNHAQFCVFS